MDAAHERSFRVRCRHHSTADYSLDGETVDGATIVGRDPAFIQPVESWTHGFFTTAVVAFKTYYTASDYNSPVIIKSLPHRNTRAE